MGTNLLIRFNIIEHSITDRQFALLTRWRIVCLEIDKSLFSYRYLTCPELCSTFPLSCIVIGCGLAPVDITNIDKLDSYSLLTGTWRTTRLTHWGRVTHICVSKLTITGSDNGLSPDQRQAIIWTNAGLLLIGPLGTNFNEILIEILTFSFKRMRLKVSSAKRRPFCLGLNVLTQWSIPGSYGYLLQL